jgi:hypothetical protein
VGTVVLYTSYLGNVELHNVEVLGDSVKLIMSTDTTGTIINTFKVIDTVHADLDPVNHMYDRTYLESLPPWEISLQRNKEAFYFIMILRKFIYIKYWEKDTTQTDAHLKELGEAFTNVDDIFQDTQNRSTVRNVLHNTTSVITLDQTLRAYREALTHNTGVDILFAMFMFQRMLVHFKYSFTQTSWICVANVPDMDNAYMIPEEGYMTIGNGGTYFLPLGTLDIVAHELGHWVISNGPNLTYQGESGALNESFADIMGAALEWYVYDTYNTDPVVENDLLGDDGGILTIGEDATSPFLRHMQDPEAGRQPSKYRGEFWVDTNSSIDYGGVHTNSGVNNKCFADLVDLVGMEQSVEVFLTVLNLTNSNSQYLDMANLLLTTLPSDDMVTILDNVQLGQFIGAEPTSPPSTGTGSGTGTKHNYTYYVITTSLTLTVLIVLIVLISRSIGRT